MSRCDGCEHLSRGIIVRCGIGLGYDGCEPGPHRTEAEALTDRILAEQRAKGRATYGKGLDHRDPLDWRMEALRELADAVQYLSAEVLRLEAQIAAARRAADGVCAPADTGE